MTASATWSWPLRVDALEDGLVELVHGVVYTFEGLERADWPSSRLEHYVPKGFRCDGASVPDGDGDVVDLGSFVPNSLRTLAGAVFHDHVYMTGRISKALADHCFGLILLTHGPGSAAASRAKRMEFAVRVFAGGAWRKHRKHEREELAELARRRALTAARIDRWLAGGSD